MSVELTIPEAGESITEVQIGRWLKSDGDTVEKDEEVVELETDKASMMLAAPEAGVLKIVVQEGDFAEVGDVIGRIEESDEEAGARDEDPRAEDAEQDEIDSESADDAEEKEEADSETGDEGREDAKDEDDDAAGESDESEADTDSDEPRVMPAARRLLDEHGLEADDVKATGPGGRLLKEDVQRHVTEGEAREAARAALHEDQEAESGEAAEPARDAAADRREEVRPMSMIRRTIANRLVEAQREAALLTTFNEVDMQPIKDLRARHQEEFQERHDVKLGFMSFFVKASVAALQRFPAVNSIVRDKEIVTRHYYDVGIAVGGGKGLVVPVIRDADRLSFAEIERRIADFGARAQDNDIQPEELEGGTFTISNGGIYGSLLSTPIVNPPQSGILGMHAIQDRPVVRDGDVVVRPMMYVALTYDHRIIDGREAVTFLRTIKEFLEEPERLVLDL